MSDLIVDTNIPVVAAGSAVHASPDCRANCLSKIKAFVQGRDRIVVDDQWLIVKEYKKNLQSLRHDNIGSEFLKWLLTNRENQQKCLLVPVTILGENDYAEFPDCADLLNFDPSDRKFVATAISYRNNHDGAIVSIINAVDPDWWDFRVALGACDIDVEFICSDQVEMWKVERRETA